MSVVRAFLPTPPPTVTHNDLEVRYRTRNGRQIPYVGKSARLREAEDGLVAQLRRVAPETPLRGPLRMTVRYCFATGGRHAQGEPHTDRPDADNLDKTLRDCCTRAGIIVDDSLVCDARTLKAWSDPAGVHVTIAEIGAGDAPGAMDGGDAG